jgi:hypothetical protein
VAVERATEQMVSSSSTVNFDDASSRQKLCVSEVVQSCSAERKLAHTAHPTTTTRLHPSPFAHRAIPRLQQQPSSSPLSKPLSVFYPAPLCRTTPQFNISYPTFFKSHSNILDELCFFPFFFYDQTKARRFSGATDLLLSNYWGEKGAWSCCFFFRLLTWSPPVKNCWSEQPIL